MKRSEKGEPSILELKQFGILMAVFISLGFGLILPLFWRSVVTVWPFILSMAFLMAGLIRPLLLKHIYHIWMIFARFLGQINFYIIMGIIYYLLFSPIALFFRLMGKDPMNRKFLKHEASYRETCINKNKDHMERPY